MRSLTLLGILFLWSCTDVSDDNNSNCGVEENLIEESLDEGFVAFTEEEEFIGINPDSEVTYWQILHKDHNDSIHFVASGGTKCCGVIAPADCERVFDPFGGSFDIGTFWSECYPGYCSSYTLRYHKGDEYFFVESIPEMRAFLEKIDSRSDVHLLLLTHDYFIDLNDPANGSMKKVENGYEVLALKLISDCLPFEIRRFHLLVHDSGYIEILSHELYQRLNVCP